MACQQCEVSKAEVDFEGIRVHAISFGPLATRFRDARIRRLLSKAQEDIGKAVLFLALDGPTFRGAGRGLSTQLHIVEQILVLNGVSSY
jgi:hypothetical protein